MKKILLSIATIVLVGSAVAGFTGAFYGDTERSTGNTFTAGSIELKVDSESHYNNMICTEQGWQPDGTGETAGFPEQGSPCDGTWEETDLEDGVQKYFNFSDLKPGDEGEVTISLHVYDNDAWGQFEFIPTRDADNTCTEPETTAENAENNNTICSDPDGDGEIDENLYWTAWLDQGGIPGFQCGDPRLNGTGGAGCERDPLEGDNIRNEESLFEFPLIWDNTLIGETGPFDLREVLSAAWALYGCEGESGDGHNDYGSCHGLARDGRMVGSTTYYFGLQWDFPLETGNEIQTDSYITDMIFRVEQMRNNPNPFQI